MWIVDFANGLRHESSCNALTVVASGASLLPQGFSPQAPQLPQCQGEQQEATGDSHCNEDNEIEEHLPSSVEEDEDEVEDGPTTGEGGGEEEEEGAVASAEAPVPMSHTQRLVAAKAEIVAKLGETVTIKHSAQIVCKVVEGSQPTHAVQQRQGAGLLGIDLCEKSHRGLPKTTVLAEMFLHLTFLNWRESLQVMNKAILETCGSKGLDRGKAG